MVQAGLLDAFATQQKWLVLRLGHMGDVALITGVLGYLHKQYGLQFHVLTNRAWQPLLQENPCVEKTISFLAKPHSFLAEFQFFQTLSKEYKNWGLLDLHGTMRSCLLGALWQGPVARYPKMGFERRMFLHTKKAQYSTCLQQVQVTQRYALALEKTPPKASALLPCLWLTEQEETWGKKTLAEIFLPDIRPVAVHPFATHKWKTWTVERWHDFIQSLEKRNIPYLVVGKGTPLLPASPYDFTNKTSLRETCALLKGCSALVTGDSGPMHLASSVGTPVVVFFGPTTKEWGFYPVGENDVVFEQGLQCRPCSLHGKKICPHNGKCLQDISVDKVCEAVARLYFGGAKYV